MSKHTAGPWRLGPDAIGDLRTIWAAKAGICITSAFDSRMGSDAPPLREAKANARLIAAAPELLSVLDEILTYGGGADSALDDPYVMERARAAIAKAKGAA